MALGPEVEAAAGTRLLEVLSCSQREEWMLCKVLLALGSVRSTEAAATGLIPGLGPGTAAARAPSAQ